LYRTQSCPVAIEVRVYLAMLVSMSIMVIVLMVMVVRCLIVLGRIMLMVVRFVIVSSLMIMHGFAPYDKPYDFCYRCNKSLSRTSNN